MTLDLDSDKFRCFNHRDELNSAVQLLNSPTLGSIKALNFLIIKLPHTVIANISCQKYFVR